MSAGSGLPTERSSSRRVSWEEARIIAAAAGAGLGRGDYAVSFRSVSLREAIGRTLAADIVALADVPCFASAAMDGWVVAENGPWLLTDRGSAGVLKPGEARRIVTGGLVPNGATAVLRSEHGVERGVEQAQPWSIDPSSAVLSGTATVSGTATLSVTPAGIAPRPGQHIRPAGEEARRGELLVPSGRILSPIHISLAAAAGLDSLAVREPLSVALVFTGDEVVESGIPGPGHVRDSFGPQLWSVIRMLGADAVSETRLPDSLEQLRAAIAPSTGPRAALTITTGGTGHSAVDHLRPALAELGADLLIDGVAMRPGGPSLLARLSDGRLVLGLPGNPLAAMLALLSLLPPLVAGAHPADPAPGLETELETGPESGPEPGSESAARTGLTRVTVADALAGTGHSSVLVPFSLEAGAAVPTGWRGSGMLRGLAAASGVFVCPPGGVSAGDSVDAIALPWTAAIGR